MPESSPSVGADGGSSRVRVAGSILIAGGLVFFLLNMVAEGTYPNYDVGTYYLSDLGAIGANTYLLWNGMLFTSGVLLLVAGYLLFFTENQFRATAVGGRTTIVGVLYLLPGIGAIIVSLFPGNSSLGAAGMHSIGAFTTFVFGGVSAVYAVRLTKAPFRYFSVVLGVITLVSIPVFVYSGVSVAGLTERLIVYPFVLWAMCFGAYLSGVHLGERASV
ncbi:MAG: DUF998 domain-containing protein [Nitrososphaerota archaeon]|nr:DUF998 domain-containing protein [Nitrososphaerota archaeon]MDG6946484.1 DUF998 domain-containing protein [Nitrososphaerota archaeon]MDG6947764.1 DUF998 domain-containing protein [Nitrososphaerota archaeon]